MGDAFSDRVCLEDGTVMQGNISGRKKINKKMQSAIIVQSQRERCRRELRQH